MNYKLSKKAENDFIDILEYTFKRFGSKQATKYKNSLKDCFSLLADTPYLGRLTDDLEDFRKHKHGQHLIFYIIRKNDVYVVRILHESMDIQPSLFFNHIFH